MIDNNHDIDQLIKEKVENFNFSPPKDMFDSIISKSAINDNPAKGFKVSGYVYPIGIFIVGLIIGVGITYYYFKSNPEEIKETLPTIIKEQKNTLPSSINSNSIESIPQTNDFQNNEIEQEKRNTTQKNNTLNTLPEDVENQKESSSQPKAITGSIVNPQEVTLEEEKITNQEDVLTLHNNQVVEAEEQEIAIEDPKKVEKAKKTYNNPFQQLKENIKDSVDIIKLFKDEK